MKNWYSRVRLSLRGPRKKVLDALDAFRILFDRCAIYVVSANVLAYWLKHWALTQRFLIAFWQVIPFNDHLHIEPVVLYVESFSVCLFGLQLLASVLFLKDETRFWTHGCKGRTIRAIRDWLTGESLSSPDLTDGVQVVCAKDTETRRKVSSINHRAYERGYFGMSEDELIERNNELMIKNDLTFNLYLDGNRDLAPIAFSCLLPLTPDATEDYLAGRIPDHAFRARHITSKTERPSLVILFAIALDPDFPVSRWFGTAYYSPYLGGCLKRHLGSILKEVNGDRDYPPIVVQAETWWTKHRYKQLGFRPTKKRSADKKSSLRLMCHSSNFPKDAETVLIGDALSFGTPLAPSKGSGTL